MPPYRPAIDKKLKSQMDKIYKKDRPLYDSLMKMILEILSNPNRYNL